MLYSLYETQHTLLEPWRFAAEAARGWFGHPFSPFTYSPLARRITAANDLFLRVTQRYEKPAWNIAAADIEVALEKPFCRLIHFKQNQAAGRKVLLVAPLSGHHATLLRDTVRSLLPDHDVWVTDWVDAKMVPIGAGPFHLADYVDYIREFIRLVGDPVSVISVCQPTVPVLCAVALMAQDGEAPAPRALVMMGGPIDARRSPTAVNNLAMHKPYSWFERNVIERVPQKYPGFMRRVYPGFLQHLGFVAMNPARHLTAHWDYFKHLHAGDEDSAPYGPGSAAPFDDGSGPEGYPIKGNADSMLYHVPGGRYYDATKAEAWFATEADAEAAGFSAPPSASHEEASE